MKQTGCFDETRTVSQFGKRGRSAEKFRDAVNPAPLGEEQILLKEARGRVLPGCDRFDQRSFYDRSNFDGYAVRAEDTFGAEETRAFEPQTES